MNTKKLNLNELKVSSFVTALGNKNEYTIKGGTGPGTAIDVVPILAATASIVVMFAAVYVYDAISDNSSKNNNKKN